MDEFDDKLKRHIDQVMAHSESNPDRPLSLKEMKQLALSMDMSESEWDALMLKAEVMLQTAIDHLTHQNFKDAQDLAEQATAINPYLRGGYGVLAHALHMRSVHEEGEALEMKAEKAAQEALKNDPDDNRALKVLSAIRRLDRDENKSNKLLKNLAIIGGAVIVAVIVLIFVFREGSSSSSDTTGTNTPTTSTESVKFQLIDAEEACNEAWIQVSNQLQRRDKAIPKLVQLVGDGNPEIDRIRDEIQGLQTDISSISNTDDNYAAKQGQLQALVNLLIQTAGESNADKDQLQYIIVELEGAENRISAERKRYNSKVKTYNTLVKKYGDEYPDYTLIPYFEGQ